MTDTTGTNPRHPGLMNKGGGVGEDTGMDDSNHSMESKSRSSSVFGGTTSDDSKNSSSNKETFVERETRYVFLLRILVVLILVCTAIAISVTVLHITRQGERDNFESQYQAVANKILETFLEIGRSKLGAAASLAVAEVAYGQDTAKTWPFVTMSSFQQRAASIKELSGVLSIAMHPLVEQTLRQKWQFYSTTDFDNKWYQEGLDYQRELGLERLDTRPQVETENTLLEVDGGIASQIYVYDEDADNSIVPAGWVQASFLPVWQTSPVTKRTTVNEDMMNVKGAMAAIEHQSVTFERMLFSTPGYANDTNRMTSEFAYILSMANQKETLYEGDIFSSVFFPLYNHFEEDRKVAGVMRTVIQWGRYFANVLPESKVGVVLVLENGCDEPFSYQVTGDKVYPLGHTDLHNPKFDSYQRTASMEVITKVNDGTKDGMDIYYDDCAYSIRVYPSQDFYDAFNTETPLVVTISVAIVFAFAILMFFGYDRLVEWRQSLIVAKAAQTHQIVASLFPKNVRERMLEGEKKKGSGAGASEELSAYLGGNASGTGHPIADLFPNVTVFFADIAGFTSWSSSREPVQVFLLLESLYRAYDEVANRRRVFKVETIGDSYVAVTGLPEPQLKHASIMARFAFDCLRLTEEVTHNLEKTLGPDTSELKIRVGLNSGPVTAGVLRGERSRFQLFGDTVNTAARMESTGVAGMIQCSQSTADALEAEGKSHWIRKRSDDVHAKGKGVLTTYWCNPRQAVGKASSNASASDDASKNMAVEDVLNDEIARKEARLVDWMAQLLGDHIKKVVIMHKVLGITGGKKLVVPERAKGTTNLDEVVEAISLPAFDSSKATDFARAFAEYKSEVLPAAIMRDLGQLVQMIASKYHRNPFHNFEHACHVTMNVAKFLNRIVNPEIRRSQIQVNNLEDGRKAAAEYASHLHDYTHGINSDPITILAIVFAALIHDVDHRGVSNVRLMEEQKEMGEKYRGKSVAEQNSLDIAWDLLVSDQFKKLREFIFATQEELSRFRQVIVNVVLATDIFDKQLNDLRKARWEKAFSEHVIPEQNVLVKEDDNKLRATIVMEHIIQASDVCHTMQHWHVYRKWNKRLFQEMYAAYRAGRMEKDPSTFWYKGEIGFFDNYIIPLAKKLETCGVFGVSSDECHNFAVRNRAEWEAFGERIVKEMVEELEHEDDQPPETPECWNDELRST